MPRRGSSVSVDPFADHRRRHTDREEGYSDIIDHNERHEYPPVNACIPRPRETHIVGSTSSLR